MSDGVKKMVGFIRNNPSFVAHALLSLIALASPLNSFWKTLLCATLYAFALLLVFNIVVYLPRPRKSRCSSSRRPRAPRARPAALAAELALLALAPGPAAATTCALGSYSYGSGACASCAPGTVFVALTGLCAPAQSLAPADTAFFLSGSAAEGVAAFPGAPNVSYATGVFGAANGALVLASGSSLSVTPAVGSALLQALPVGSNAWSASAWVQCEASLLVAPASSAALLVWGAPSAALSSSLALVLTGQPSACDGKWHHIAATHGDGGPAVTKSYLDGVAVASASQTLAIPSDGIASLVIGHVVLLGSYSFLGSPGSSACPPGVSSFVSPSLPCTPLTGPSDTSFYFSCDAAEGTGAYSVFNQLGISFVADRFGVPGRAVQLDGAYFSTPMPMPISVGSAARSMAVFIKCAFAGPVVLFWGVAASGQSSGFHMMPDRMRMFFYSNDVDYMGWSCDGQWHHWASTFDGYTVKLYVDGVIVQSAAKTAVNTAANTNLVIGYGLAGLALNQNNAFDDIRIYNRALSATEVAAIYDGLRNDMAMSLADIRLYNRALSVVEVLALAQPPLTTLVANTIFSPPVLLASSYSFSCAAGSAGTGGYLYQNAADNSWLWSGGGAAPVCVPCAAGTAAQPGAATCAPCPPGTYALAGAASCSLCPAGTFGASAGATSALCSGACASCAAGSTFSAAVATSCPAGSVPSGSALGACAPCGPGTFAPAGAASCSLCPAGTFGSTAGLSSSACSGYCGACAPGSLFPPLADSMTCASSGARAAPAGLGLLLWPAAHPGNAQRADLIVAPLAACQQLTSEAACAEAASVKGTDGQLRYVVGTAAALHLEAAEPLTCAAQYPSPSVSPSARATASASVSRSVDATRTASPSGSATQSVSASPSARPTPLYALGGNSLTRVNGKFIHSFTSVGAQSFIVAGAPLVVDVLVVAGGGGGGYDRGPGGGAGGVLFLQNVMMSPGTYSVSVGDGGAGTVYYGYGALIGHGGDSSIAGIATATGGGGPVSNGGSGGGNGGAGVDGQGHAGGQHWPGRCPISDCDNSGGGGGAGSPGADGSTSVGGAGGNGGDGLAFDISGQLVYYGGGGGGSISFDAFTGTSNTGFGGRGGGGNSGQTRGANGAPGAPNTGGGGGGGANQPQGSGGAGGSGIVIISYSMST